MANLHTRDGGKRGCLCAAGAACAAAIAFSGASEAQSPKPDSPTRGAAGAVVHYEEAPGSNVIYLEESGGMVSTVALAVPAARKPLAAKPAPRDQAVAGPRPAKPSGSATRVVQRRLAPLEGAGNRP